jgi:hypothetical protein
MIKIGYIQIITYIVTGRCEIVTLYVTNIKWWRLVLVEIMKGNGSLRVVFMTMYFLLASVYKLKYFVITFSQTSCLSHKLFNKIEIELLSYQYYNFEILL